MMIVMAWGHISNGTALISQSLTQVNPACFSLFDHIAEMVYDNVSMFYLN